MADKMERVACRTPSEQRDGVTNIPKWKFDLLRRHIRAIVRDAGDAGFPFSEMTGALRGRLSECELTELGSLGWHATTVKLEMEVAGDLKRLSGSPQRLVLTA